MMPKSYLYRTKIAPKKNSSYYILEKRTRKENKKR